MRWRSGVRSMNVASRFAALLVLSCLNVDPRLEAATAMLESVRWLHPSRLREVYIVYTLANSPTVPFPLATLAAASAQAVGLVAPRSGAFLETGIALFHLGRFADSPASAPLSLETRLKMLDCSLFGLARCSRAHGMATFAAFGAPLQDISSVAGALARIVRFATMASDPNSAPPLTPPCESPPIQSISLLSEKRQPLLPIPNVTQVVSTTRHMPTVPSPRPRGFPPPTAHVVG
jgi:hypothetical protein